MAKKRPDRRPSGRWWLGLGVAACLLGTAQAQEQIPSQPVRFAPGAGSATVSGKLNGPDHGARDHVLRAKAGQTMTVDLATASTYTYFNVLPPGSETAIAADVDKHWSGVLPADGDYTIRVYLVRAAQRRGAAASYALQVGVR